MFANKVSQGTDAELLGLCVRVRRSAFSSRAALHKHSVLQGHSITPA